MICQVIREKYTHSKTLNIAQNLAYYFPPSCDPWLEQGHIPRGYKHNIKHSVAACDFERPWLELHIILSKFDIVGFFLIELRCVPLSVDHETNKMPEVQCDISSILAWNIVRWQFGGLKNIVQCHSDKQALWTWELSVIIPYSTQLMQCGICNWHRMMSNGPDAV